MCRCVGATMPIWKSGDIFVELFPCVWVFNGQACEVRANLLVILSFLLEEGSGTRLGRN